MSSGLECQFVETNGEWYYALQNSSIDPIGGSWLEDALAFGPFPTEDNAYIHLHDNHANPGGYSVADYGDDNIPPLWRQLIAAAEPPSNSRARGMVALAW